MIPLSAVFITQDEERNLPEALESVRFCDEVVVVDSGSGDGTRAVAEAAGARVVVNAPWPGYLAQRNVSVDAAQHDWVLAMDADERVSPALREEIQDLRQRGFQHAGYRIPRVAFYLGRWIRATDWYPDFQLRLFDRRLGRCEGALVHESIHVRGSVGRLGGEIEHFPYADVSDHLNTIDRYTTLWARQSLEAGLRASWPALCATPTWAFFRNYLLRGGLRLGKVGLTISVLNSYYTFLKRAKLLELARERGRGLPRLGREGEAYGSGLGGRGSAGPS